LIAGPLENRTESGYPLILCLALAFRLLLTLSILLLPLGFSPSFLSSSVGHKKAFV
jgi:hypothetical protein